MRIPKSNVSSGERAGFYTIFRWPGIARVCLVGDVDLAALPALGGWLRSMPADYDLVELNVDLSETTFLDCAGVSALLRARQDAAELGCLLYLSNPQLIVRRILDLTGTLDLLTSQRREPSSAVARSPADDGDPSQRVTVDLIRAA